MKIALKLLLIFLATLLSITISGKPENIKAQGLTPPPPPTLDEGNCTDENEPEFHSLRPYPGQPCNKSLSELAYMCGNDLLLKDEIKVSPSDGSCVAQPDRTLICNYDLPRNLTLVVDPSQAKFPIAGNTENVVNSENPDPGGGFKDAQKVNDYVSWYLNGVINRAEEEFLSYKDPASIKKLINFSGPIKKLLPLRIQQEEAREQVIESQLGTIRHNQITACTYGIDTILGRIESFPTSCYKSGFAGLLAPFVTELRLSDWNNKDKLPPKEEDFANFTDWWLAYRRWRGDSCIPVSFGGLEFFICFDSPGRANIWATLFPYIPFSSTEDRKGELTIQTPTQHSSSEVTVSDIRYNGTTTTPLYFAHMEEDVDLATLLQKTYLSNEITSQSVSGSDIKPPEIGPECQIFQVRSNPGDKLLGKLFGGTVDYRAQFQCTFAPLATPTPNPILGCIPGTASCAPFGGDGICAPGYDRIPNIGCDSDGDGQGAACVCPGSGTPDDRSCTKTAVLASKVNTGTPKADELWTKLVAGNAAIFRRMFPKIGPDSPVEKIVDIPGVDSINYSTGNKDGTNTESSEIYFPHIGALYEYFLQGIQKALRPKEFSSGSGPFPN